VLVTTCLDLARHVAATCFGFDLGLSWMQQQLAIVDGHGKRQRIGIIADDEHGPDRHVLGGHDPVGIGERELSGRRLAQSHVISVRGVLTAIAVPEQAIMA